MSWKRFGLTPGRCPTIASSWSIPTTPSKASATRQLWGRELRAEGHEMIGIRLDSGDLAWLSIEARKILDEAGFPNAVIVASNDLDETIITSLKDQGATIACWGVGTRLATAYDEPALGGVYKLSAIREPGNGWQYKVKLSEQAIKVSNPGVLQVRRYYGDGRAVGDMIFDEEVQADDGATMVDPFDATRRKRFFRRCCWRRPVENHSSVAESGCTTRHRSTRYDRDSARNWRPSTRESNGWSTHINIPWGWSWDCTNERPNSSSKHEVCPHDAHSSGRRCPQPNAHGLERQSRQWRIVMAFTYEYPRAALTVDCVVFGLDDEDLKVLLIQRDLEPFAGQWALPGGFCSRRRDARRGGLAGNCGKRRACRRCFWSSSIRSVTSTATLANGSSP